MSKKIISIFIILALAIVLAVFLFFQQDWQQVVASYFHKPGPVPSGIILFYSDNCSHCLKVNTFIKNNDIESKIAFTKLDILNNAPNVNILADKAQTCGVDPEQIGVPFLWDGKNCIIGDVDVIKFFASRIAKK